MTPADSDALFTAGVGIFVGYVVHLTAGFLTRVVMARYLPAEEFGQVMLGLSLLGITAIAVLGLDRGVGRFVPRTQSAAERVGVVVSAFRITFPVSLLLAAVVLFLSGPLSSLVFGDGFGREIVVLTALAIPAQVVVRVGIGAFQGAEAVGPRILVDNLLLPLSKLLFVVAVVLVGGNAVAVAGAIPVSLFLAAGVVCYFLWHIYPVSDVGFETARQRELLTFSLPILLLAVSNMLLSNLNEIFLGFFRGPTQVGVYSAVFTLGRLVLVLLLSFSFLTMPVISRHHDEDNHDEVRRIYESVSKWLVLLSFPLAFLIIVFPEFVISLTFGAEYTGGSLALRVLGIGFLLRTVSGPNEDALLAAGHSRGLMVDGLGALATYLLLGLVLIPRYGILGAAVAITVTFGVMNLLFLHRLRRRLGVTPLSRGYLKALLLGVTIMVAAHAAVHLTGVTSRLESAAFAAAGTVLFFAVLFVTDDLSDEIDLVLGLIRERTGVGE